MNEAHEEFAIGDFEKHCEVRGFSLTGMQIDQFVRYAHGLQKWNDRVNLTAIVDFGGILLKHFVDCLELIPVMQSLSGVEGLTVGPLLDFGTGAGFPGLVLKLAIPDLSVTLCDSLRKRTDFLEHVVDDLALSDVTVIHGRAEELASHREYREQFLQVVARAVARLSVLAELAGPLVDVGGFFHAMKGPSPETEMDDARIAMERVGFSHTVVNRYSLPLNAGDHTVVSLYKDRHTSNRFPRKMGDAQRSPLV